MAKKPTVKRKPKVPKTLDLLDELIKDAVAVSNRPDFDKLRAIAKGNKFKIPDVPGVIVAAGNKPEDKSALSGHVPDHMLNRGVPKGIDEVETRENERIDRAIGVKLGKFDAAMVDKFVAWGFPPPGISSPGIGKSETTTPEPKVATVEQLRIGFLEDERRRLTEEIKLTHEIYARILDRFLMD